MRLVALCVADSLVLLLAFALVVDVLIAFGDCRVLGDPKAALAVVVPCVPPAPRGGLVTAVVLAEQALVSAWPWALAGGAWRVFGGTKAYGPEPFDPSPSPGAYPQGFGFEGRGPTRRAQRGRALTMLGRAAPVKLSVLAWLLVVVVLVLGRPYGHPGADDAARVARAVVVARLLLGSDLLAVAAGAAAVWRAWTPDRRWGRSPIHAAMLVLLVTEAAVAFIGPYVRDPYAEWDYARALYVLGFGAVAALVARGAGRPPPAP